MAVSPASISKRNEPVAVSGILAQHNVTEVKSVSKMLLIVFINLMVFLSFDFIDLILHV